MPDSEALTGDEILNLGQDFPPVATATWEAAIQKDLKGADYQKKLVWRTDEGIPVRPYYRSDALAGLEAQTASVPGRFPFVRGDAGPWQTDQSSAPPPADAIRADLVLESGADAVQQLAVALAAGVEKLTQFCQDRPVDVAARKIEFIFAVGSTYFFEIAKLRAARLLWAQAVAAFSPTDPDSCRMRLHVRTSRLNKSLCDPHTNVLRATTEAMSAAIGGCKSLTVQPFGFDNHLALGIQRVLAEEAHLNAVADPAAGSYYIETLTASLAHEAWKLFQRIESTGGYTQSLPWLAEEIAKARATREKAISSRRNTLVGVNNFPDLAGSPLKSDPDAETAAAPFPQFRLAEPFEQIRQRTERHAIASGHTPNVLLLKRGDVKMRTARANFALNFFGCAGFTIAESDSEELAGANPDLIVLCSSDPEYLPFAHEICSIAKVPVIVAGNPKDQIDALKAAGVQGFIHVASDAIETLTSWQDRLGVSN